MHNLRPDEAPKRPHIADVTRLAPADAPAPQRAEFTVLVVEADRIVRGRLRQLLLAEPDVQLVPMLETAEQLGSAMARHTPDLVLLDLGVLGANHAAVTQLIRSHCPAAVIVFSAAGREPRPSLPADHDVLIKPFDSKRLHDVVVRARAQVDHAQRVLKARRDVSAWSWGGGAPGPYPQRLALRTSGRIVLLSASEVEFIDGARNYCRVTAGNRRVEVRETLASLEARLDPGQFVRIHRSTIVNLGHLSELIVDRQGGYAAVLRGGQRRPVSRPGRVRLLELLFSGAAGAVAP